MKIKLIGWITLCLFFVNCSSDDESGADTINTTEFIKSVVYLNLPVEAPNRDGFYQYEKGLLKSSSGFARLTGQYSYDNNERLISKVKYNGYFTYEYDDKGRIVKQNEEGTNNYIELFYESGKVITNKYYEFGGTNGIPNSNLEERELLIDKDGRVIKMIDLAPEESSIPVDYETYEYDEMGNIVKVVSKISNEQEPRVSYYEYENIKNPYFNSFKGYYEKAYYLEFYAGIGLAMFNNYGLTPNLIKSKVGESIYEINESNLPTKEFKRSLSDVYEIYYEYFE